MKNKLNCILLVDDDQPTNFFNEIVIKKSCYTDQVYAVQTGMEALEFLKSRQNGVYPQPDLILLDVNMPAMNGWEFLEEYKSLPKEQRGNIVVVMLTTSLNPDDKSKASTINEISGFKSKPLTLEILNEIIKEFFPKIVLI